MPKAPHATWHSERSEEANAGGSLEDDCWQAIAVKADSQFDVRHSASILFDLFGSSGILRNYTIEIYMMVLPNEDERSNYF